MLLGGLDVGTTGCKLTVYAEDGTYIDNEYIEYETTRTEEKQEVDATLIFSAVCRVIKATYEKHKDLSAIGITTFGETFAALDENDTVLLPSMLYTDPRGEEETAMLINALGENTLINITGTKPHPMYSLPKVMWIKNNLPQVYAKIKRILLMEDYIVYMLTGVAQLDYSLAARTMALDIRKKCWSDAIFKASGVDKDLFSTPCAAGSVAGPIKEDMAKNLGIESEITIVNGSHDQVAAAIGAGVFKVGMAVDGTGTVECVTPVFDAVPENETLYEEGYSVVPYVFDGTYVCYALSFTGGAVLKWYRDNFAAYESKIAEEEGKNVYAMLDKAVQDKPTSILVMPHFAGAANPYMDNGSKAAIIGLTLEHKGIDIYKALMEGVTYEIMMNIDHLASCGINLEKLTATGGGASSPLWLQIKADILGRPITALDAKEAGACGTCMMVAVAKGLYSSLEEAGKYFVKTKKTYEPNAEKHAVYNKNYQAYKQIYNAVRPIIKEVYHE